MRVLTTILSLLAIVLTTVVSFEKAVAYESDTHLRMTYLLARSVGINDETAKYLAYSDLNIDKSILTSAMLHPAQRGLFHFTGTYEKLQSSSHGGEGVLTRIKELFWTRKIAIAERNHAMGSLLIYLGMQKGDLQMIGAGLHVKQDTYGHAGFTNAWGHMFDGHNPDRAFLETEKYEDMIRSLTQSMVAIRDILPENMLDRAAAVKYLNNFASVSSLKRNLKNEDLNSATTISAVLLSSTELRRMYSENLFNNYSFKKLALKMIYDDFKARGIINKEISFEKLFPEELLRDTRMDTADTIKAIIVSDMESDFMKNKDGVDIIDNVKLFGLENSEQQAKKMELEAERYAARLREFENRRKKSATQGQLSDLDYQIEKESLQKEYVELSFGMNLGNVNDELADVVSSASVEKQAEVLKKENEIKERYKNQLETAEKIVADGLARQLPFEDRIEALRVGGELAEKIMTEISEMKREVLFEEFIKVRSRQLAEYKLATEVADRLTKDFIPRKYTQYIKQAFETETYTRVFEVFFKDEAWRRYFDKYFNVSWVFDDGKRSTIFSEMISKFKRAINRKGAYQDALAKRTQRLLEREAIKLAEERIPNTDQIEISSRKDAHVLKYSTQSVLSWNIMMLKYVGPALLPIIGERYLGKLYDLAEKNAKKHEIEDIKKAIEEGRYQSPANAKVLNQVANFAAPNKCIRLFVK